MNNKSILTVGTLGIICAGFGLFRYKLTLAIAFAIARTAPGRSSFYAEADKSLKVSQLIIAVGVTMLLGAGISYLIRRSRETRHNAA